MITQAKKQNDGETLAWFDKELGQLSPDGKSMFLLTLQALMTGFSAGMNCKEKQD